MDFIQKIGEIRMEWIILVAGILGLGAIFGNAVTSERDHTSQGLSEEPTGKVVSLQSYQQRNADYHAEQEEEMIRLHEETVQRELIDRISIYKMSNNDYFKSK